MSSARLVAAVPEIKSDPDRDRCRKNPFSRLRSRALTATRIEWYDFFLYRAAAALVFPVLFLSRDLPPLVAQLASFSTFAVGFVARPVGAVVFGHFGDRAGRKIALVTALLIMGVSTTLAAGALTAIHVR